MDQELHDSQSKAYDAACRRVLSEKSATDNVPLFLPDKGAPSYFTLFSWWKLRQELWNRGDY